MQVTTDLSGYEVQRERLVLPRKKNVQWDRANLYKKEIYFDKLTGHNTIF